MYERTQRRLATIVSADVVVCLHLMGVDEAGTPAVHRARCGELIDPLISAHDGHIIEAIIDGLPLEIFSVIAAVECGVARQKRLPKWCSAFEQCMRRT